ncbi:2-hydroxyisoflavanone dehydratase-like [Actinidia eriantha]|uniref:2-hydroxyisoflavanone dehydratase-like n=1 Tax=Actinidia eriantha TaxID=165200 RepID=UPI002582FC76|nr:2-hydroxyisoflavanone dehydratase-like [Actinidia eriantha]
MVSDTKTPPPSDLLPVLRVHKDGTVERLLGSPFVLPSPNDPTTGVSSKDTTISPHVSARLYLPPNTTHQKLPVLVYFHGGGFCIESAFSLLCHRYVTSLVALAKIIVVSVEYRLAPEHPLPAAYEDSWATLQWVSSHSLHQENPKKDPWLTKHGDFERLYIGGDSAGANIAHNMAIKASEGLFGGVRITGAILSHPFFWGSDPVGSEPVLGHDQTLSHRTWALVYPNAPGGVDNPMINPFARNGPGLAGLGCCRLLVCVATEDELRERGVKYCDEVRKSGWGGELELFEVEGEGHCFHILNPESDNAKNMMKCLSDFLLQ